MEKMRQKFKKKDYAKIKIICSRHDKWLWLKHGICEREFKELKIKR